MPDTRTADWDSRDFPWPAQYCRNTATGEKGRLESRYYDPISRKYRWMVRRIRQGDHRPWDEDNIAPDTVSDP